MPAITIEAGTMDSRTKAQLIRELVRKPGEITRIPAQTYVTLINENETDNIGNGTRTLTEVMAERK